MKKLRLIVAAVTLAFGALTLGGCATYATADEPAQVGEGGFSSSYEIKYVQVENEVIKCLWYNKGSHTGSMSCDFEHPVTEKVETTNDEFNTTYEVEYVQVGEEQTVKCLWYNKGSKSSAVSCDWRDK